MQEKIIKVLLGLGVVGALVVGGTQLAGAQGTSTTTSPAPAQADAESGPDKADAKDGPEASDAVPAADAAKAEAAALAKVGSGKVTEVSAEHSDAGDQAEKPDPGEPAYEAQIAYDVEVTKPDGSAIDVHLDRAFTVLGTSAAHSDQGDHGDAAD